MGGIMTKKTHTRRANLKHALQKEEKGKTSTNLNINLANQSQIEGALSLDISRKHIQEWITIDKSPKKYSKEQMQLVDNGKLLFFRGSPQLHESGDSELCSVEQESIMS